MQQETTRDGTRERPVVLLAEDNDDTRRVYGLILRHYGYQVEEATNGEDAVATGARAAARISSSWTSGCPRLDGWQASRILKSDPLTRYIPLIAFSAHVDSTADLVGTSTLRRLHPQAGQPDASSSGASTPICR